MKIFGIKKAVSESVNTRRTGLVNIYYLDTSTNQIWVRNVTPGSIIRYDNPNILYIGELHVKPTTSYLQVYVEQMLQDIESCR